MLKEEHQAIFNVANAAILKVNIPPPLSLYQRQLDANYELSKLTHA
jgi:hypothetical protein